MSKEELRHFLLKQAHLGGRTLEEALVENCVAVQIEMHELDVEKVLDMPCYAFDLIVKEIIKRNKPYQNITEREGVAFGGR